jgi:hypothetical protein
LYMHHDFNYLKRICGAAGVAQWLSMCFTCTRALFQISACVHMHTHRHTLTICTYTYINIHVDKY